MSESRNCHHRFSLHAETIGFTTNDGLDIFQCRYKISEEHNIQPYGITCRYE